MDKRKYNILENGIYLLIWLVIFLVPLFGFREDGSIQWDDVKRSWLIVLPYFVLFLINNFILVPILLLRKRYLSYFLFVTLIIGVLFISVSVMREKAHPRPPFHGQDPRMERPERPRLPDDEMRPLPEFRNPPPNMEDMRKPRRMLPKPWVISLILSIFVVGVNIAIRLLFKSIQDERQFKDLESQSLKAELNYLKAQINPHFFMNTLNNIHALIDMDTEKAKESIIELSKIMRYVLYEGNMPYVSLAKEVQFIDNYIALMRIRYTDEVEIETRYPEDVSGIMLPPLMFVVLIENAFKHGISYRQPSFIHTELIVEDGKILYRVRNSISGEERAIKSGVGLDNLKKRLSLLFGKDYSLIIEAKDGVYTGTLIIPTTA